MEITYNKPVYWMGGANRCEAGRITGFLEEIDEIVVEPDYAKSTAIRMELVHCFETKEQAIKSEIEKYEQKIEKTKKENKKFVLSREMLHGEHFNEKELNDGTTEKYQKAIVFLKSQLDEVKK